MIDPPSSIFLSLLISFWLSIGSLYSQVSLCFAHFIGIVTRVGAHFTHLTLPKFHHIPSDPDQLDHFTNHVMDVLRTYDRTL